MGNFWQRRPANSGIGIIALISRGWLTWVYRPCRPGAHGDQLHTSLLLLKRNHLKLWAGLQSSNFAGRHAPKNETLASKSSESQPNMEPLRVKHNSRIILEAGIAHHCQRHSSINYYYFFRSEFNSKFPLKKILFSIGRISAKRN